MNEGALDAPPAPRFEAEPVSAEGAGTIAGRWDAGAATVYKTAQKKKAVHLAPLFDSILGGREILPRYVKITVALSRSRSPDVQRSMPRSRA